MEPTRDEIRNWLRQALAVTRETPTGLARKAGVAQSTITRFLNDDTAPMMGLRTIAKIAHVAKLQPIGLPPPAAPNAPAGSFSDTDAEPYRAEPGTPLDAAILALIAGRNAVDPWVLRTQSLEAAGYLPGDIVIVDLNAQPESGDVVCAQVYRWQEGRAETVFRIYEAPYLVAASRDPNDRNLRKPLLVDNDRIIIKGAVRGLVRAHA